MALSKQAKILTKVQADAVYGYLRLTRYPARNRAIFLLSLKAGLRAKEIASLRWEMLTDAEWFLTPSDPLRAILKQMGWPKDGWWS